MHTEAEAKTKWCHAGGDRPDDSFNCIASGCMAWRWIDGEFEYHWGDTPEGEGWEDLGIRDRWDGARYEKTRLWKRLHAARRGFCGLARKPEEM